MNNLDLEYLIQDFTNNIFIDKLLNEDSQTELLNFLDGAIFIANTKCWVKDLNYDDIAKRYMKKYFPREINGDNHKSSFIGALSLLVGLKLIFENNYTDIKAFVTIETYILKKIENDLKETYESIKKRFVDTTQYDIILGLGSVFNYLLEEKNKSLKKYDLIEKILDFLLDLTEFDNGTPSKMLIDNYYNNKQHSEGKEYICIGISHGLLGIYQNLSKYMILFPNDKKAGIIGDRIKEIEQFIFLLDKSTFIVPPEEIYPGGKINSNTDINASWCFGISGFFSIILNNSKYSWSLFYKQTDLIYTKLDEIILTLDEDAENLVFCSSTFCHGMAGLVYELFLIDSKRYSFYISKLVKKILKQKANDEVVFYDIKQLDEHRGYETGYHLLDGSIGTFLVINSLITDKRFKGDYLFGKL